MTYYAVYVPVFLCTRVYMLLSREQIWDIEDYCVRKDRRRRSRADADQKWQHQYEMEERFPYLVHECVFERLERGAQSLTADDGWTASRPPASSSPETTVNRPMLLSRVRCHTRAITSVVYVDDFDLIISASEDNNVRRSKNASSLSVFKAKTAMFRLESCWCEFSCCIALHCSLKFKLALVCGVKKPQ